MKKLTRYPILWILLFTMLPLWALFVPGLPITHDGQDHVARIANFYQSLTEGTIVPRWAGNLNWGYGHPILMFLYPLPSYVTSVWHTLGLTFVDSVKFTFGVSFVLSAVTMYMWMSEAYGMQAGFIGSLLYTFAPYRFVDLYVRGALGEHVAFIFPPLILYFIRKLSRTSHWRDSVWHVCGASASIAALILAHNAIAIMFLPIVAIYAVYLFFESINKWIYIVGVKISGILGFGLSSFFWIPAYLEGKYTLRDIVTAGESLQRFVPWSWFLYSPWNYLGGDGLTKSIGIAQWIGILVSIVYFIKIKNRSNKSFLIGVWIIFLCSLVIMTRSAMPVWKAISLLQKFQFPWRFLSVSVFASAVIGGISIDWTLDRIHNKLTHSVLFIAYCLLVIILTTGMWHPKGYLYKDNSFYSGIYFSTTDTGESSPIWSVRFMEHTPSNPTQVLSGNALVTVGTRTSTRHEYDITVSTPARMLENTLYFPGWNITVDGIATGIQWQDPDYRGLMTYRLTEGTHHVIVKFDNTRLRTVSNVISLISLCIVILYVLVVTIWNRKK